MTHHHHLFSICIDLKAYTCASVNFPHVFRFVYGLVPLQFLLLAPVKRFDRFFVRTCLTCPNTYCFVMFPSLVLESAIRKSGVTAPNRAHCVTSPLIGKQQPPSLGECFIGMFYIDINKTTTSLSVTHSQRFSKDIFIFHLSMHKLTIPVILKTNKQRIMKIVLNTSHNVICEMFLC